MREGGKKWQLSHLMPNTHRRRDSTGQLSLVGGVYLVQVDGR